MKNSQAYTCS